jgi:hypothetical protein
MLQQGFSCEGGVAVFRKAERVGILLVHFTPNTGLLLWQRAAPPKTGKLIF